MDKEKKTKDKTISHIQLTDDIQVHDQIYHPLTIVHWDQFSHNLSPHRNQPTTPPTIRSPVQSQKLTQDQHIYPYQQQELNEHQSSEQNKRKNEKSVIKQAVKNQQKLINNQNKSHFFQQYDANPEINSGSSKNNDSSTPEEREENFMASQKQIFQTLHQKAKNPIKQLSSQKQMKKLFSNTKKNSKTGDRKKRKFSTQNENDKGFENLRGKNKKRDQRMYNMKNEETTLWKREKNNQQYEKEFENYERNNEIGCRQFLDEEYADRKEEQENRRSQERYWREKHEQKSGFTETTKPSQISTQPLSSLMRFQTDEGERRSEQINEEVQEDEHMTELQSYSYNNLDTRMIVLHETPCFQRSLASPFFKFNQDFKGIVQELWGQRSFHQQSIKNDQDIVCSLNPLQVSPASFMENPLEYFVGIGNQFKEIGENHQALYFYRLASYVNPLAARPWIKTIDLLSKMGKYKQAMQAAKTSFLFKPHSKSAEDYLKMGDKAQIPMHELRGILPALKNIENKDKIVYECCKLQMKNRRFSRGLVLLSNYSSQTNYRSNFAYGIALMLKQLENYHQKKEIGNIKIIYDLIKKTCVKYQILSMYLDFIKYIKQQQFNKRKEFQERMQTNVFMHEYGQYHDMYDYEQEEDILQSQMHGEVVRKLQGQKSAQNILYKFYLELAEICYTYDDEFKKYQNVQKYLKKAYASVVNVTSKTKAYWEIYIKTCSFSNFYISPKQKRIDKGSGKFKGNQKKEQKIEMKIGENYQDLAKFHNNKILFINHNQLEDLNFSDWKYYFHYTLTQNYQKLYQASNQWPTVGRLIAQCIHILRMSKKPLAILRFWRQYIDKIPQAGELWCEGGRIYINLGEENNAMKCFQAALHFTPQYGDTFFELLYIYLKRNRHYDIEKLKKNFYLSQPYIGNNLSFLKYKSRFDRHTYYEIWEKAQEQIKKSLYSSPCSKQANLTKLTVLESYNEAVMNPISAQIRQRLFSSYEQLDNPKN